MSLPQRSAADEWTRAVGALVVRLTLLAGVLGGAVYVLGRLKPVIIALFVAAVMAYVIRRIAGWMAHKPLFMATHTAIARPFTLRRRAAAVTDTGGRSRPAPRRLPMHTLRVIATLYVIIGMFVGGWYSTKYLANPFVTEIKNVQDNWSEYRTRLQRYRTDATAWYERQVRPEHRRWIEQQISPNREGNDVARQAGAWATSMARQAGDVLRYIVEIVLLPVLAFYFAVESRHLKHEFVGTLPRRHQREVLKLIREFNAIMYSFVVGQAILCLIAGVFVGLFLAVAGVRYPLTLGILAGATRAIPIVGPIMGGIPIVLLALVSKGLGVATTVLIFFTVLHFVESKFIMPMLLGERLELHPVVVIVVLLIGQEFGGLLGMFFAAPVAALIRVVVRRYWVARHCTTMGAP